jgi:hypothetical protein
MPSCVENRGHLSDDAAREKENKEIREEEKGNEERKKERKNKKMKIRKYISYKKRYIVFFKEIVNHNLY